ncbi:hypothetical protein Cgig2_000681 [Carnegiea gigantea]|uniref:Uncharacterized protein n=1 Tax=Carnegiea gigantea TaxID=171969 RepID=A0A9Q1KDE9_9CARY|nr:hypothetical protein Cgig2_000681 [Carnegiea gigantea]
MLNIGPRFLYFAAQYEQWALLSRIEAFPCHYGPRFYASLAQDFGANRRTEVTDKTEPLQFQTILLGSFSLFSSIHGSSSHDSHLTSVRLHLCASLLPVFTGFLVLFCCVLFFNCICPSQFAQASLWLIASYNQLISLLQYLQIPQPSSSHRHCSWITSFLIRMFTIVQSITRNAMTDLCEFTTVYV